jgi:hypothetical protein
MKKFFSVVTATLLVLGTFLPVFAQEVVEEIVLIEMPVEEGVVCEGSANDVSVSATFSINGADPVSINDLTFGDLLLMEDQLDALGLKFVKVEDQFNRYRFIVKDNVSVE